MTIESSANQFLTVKHTFVNQLKTLAAAVDNSLVVASLFLQIKLVPPLVLRPEIYLSLTLIQIQVKIKMCLNTEQTGKQSHND